MILGGWSHYFCPKFLPGLGLERGAPDRREGASRTKPKPKYHELFKYIHFDTLVSKTWPRGRYRSLGITKRDFDSRPSTFSSAKTFPTIFFEMYDIRRRNMRIEFSFLLLVMRVKQRRRSSSKTRDRQSGHRDV